MHWLGKLGLGVAAWETGWWLLGKADRRRLYDQAKAAAVARGKPLLVVGEPDGEYPCGDVTVDIRETSVCPIYTKTTVEHLEIFDDKQFGAAFVSHVIEHVCDPQKALAELARVSDQVFISYPRPWRLATLLVPGHKWIITKQTNGDLKLHKWLGRCNIPNRYGD